MADFKGTLDEGASKAYAGWESNKKKIESTIELKKIEKEIKELNGRKAEYLFSIGQYIHMLYRNNAFEVPEIVHLFQGVIEIDKAIYFYNEKSREIKGASGMLICENCNAQMSEEEKFCSSCGERVEQAQDYQSQTSCACCENILMSTYNYCPVCGVKC